MAILKLLDEWFGEDTDKIKIAANIMKALDDDGTIKAMMS